MLLLFLHGWVALRPAIEPGDRLGLLTPTLQVTRRGTKQLRGGSKSTQLRI